MRVPLGAALALALGCSTTEVVGIDKASTALEDASADATADVAADAAADAARADAVDASAVSIDAVVRDASADGGDGGLAVWVDPVRPPPYPNQYTNDKFPSPGASSFPCPASAPAEGARCDAEGIECRYPLCWGAAHRTFVCVEGRYTLWWDESFLCAPERPCPATRPRAGDRCGLSIECVYPAQCCDGSAGYERVRCDGTFQVAGPYGCESCPSQPVNPRTR